MNRSALVGRGVLRAAVVAVSLVGVLAAGGACHAGGSVPVVPAPATGTPPPAREVAGFPDAASTGARGALKPVAGGLEVRTRGQVLSDLWVQGRLTILADDVVVSNVRVETNDFWVVANYGHNLRLESSTLIGGPDSQAGVGDLEGGSFAGVGLDVSGSADGVKMGSHSSLRRSYVHSLATRSDLHNDAVELAGARDVVLVGNTLLNENGQTSALSLGAYEPDEDAGVVVSRNLLAGGGYTVYGGAPVRGVQVTDNRFSTRYFPRGGSFGVSAYWSARGNRWAGNLWLDGPERGQPVAP